MYAIIFGAVSMKNTEAMQSHESADDLMIISI